MRNLRLRNSGWPALLAFVMAGLLVCVDCRATWVCCEGDDWLHWDAQTREAYVRAYTLGNLQGYNLGCTEGVRVAASTVRMTGQSIIDASKKCAAKATITSRDSSQFVSQVTKFYNQYPGQRFLRISDILIDLYAGKTLDQIHRSFPPGPD
jgi:transposase InsO family protein